MIKTKKRKVISENLINSLVRETSIDKRLVELLCMRDIDTKEKIDEFFNADKKESISPFVIKDMDKAVEIVKNAVSKNKRILIYGDYDCDGITAIATLKKYFDSINYEVNYYLPDRDLEGYGLSETSINNFMDLYNPELVITVDCGVSNYNEVKLLKKMGVEVLVTDHHEPPEILPETTVINPKLSDNPLKNLAGVGVSYKLVEGLTNASIAENYLDVVAIGTIADLVPLTGENRRIVKKGLSLINQNRIKGLELLNRKTKKINHVKEGDIAFTIAPMINSMGRMANANKVVELFTSTDTFFLNNLITKLEKLNAERKFACEEIFNEALKMLST
ncbi:MAG: DHH family phosphoesterase, partial [Clostridia bacterium]|nr:DHH family phosphoesterase [Clostridia bacterium]